MESQKQVYYMLKDILVIRLALHVSKKVNISIIEFATQKYNL